MEIPHKEVRMGTIGNVEFRKLFAAKQKAS
jgi:hypothetical protein